MLNIYIFHNKKNLNVMRNWHISIFFKKKDKIDWKTDIFTYFSTRKTKSVENVAYL